jgi:hypothetical protein
MHFFGTYTLARTAGFPPEQARTIATAAQFVDDAVAAVPVSLGGQAYLLPVVSAHRMLELKENFDPMDQWRVWVPFHFLPGGRGNTADERLICLWAEPGNPAADAILRLAMASGAAGDRYALHLLGIVTHVIQDTYSHYGFSGIAHEHNLVDQTSLTPLNAEGMHRHLADALDAFTQRISASFAEITQLGHSGAGTYPDRPYLRWSLRHEQPSRLDDPSLTLSRNNPDTYYLACTRLHAVYRAYVRGATEIPDPGHRPFRPASEREIKAILAEEDTMEGRCRRWMRGIESGLLFQPETADLELEYSAEGWDVEAMTGTPLAVATQAYLFNRAARHYLESMLDDILPSMGILVR